MVLNNQKWEKRIYGLHQTLAMILPLPDMTRPGEKLWTVTHDQAQELADAAWEVWTEYGLDKLVNSKAGALGMLGMISAMIYVPKLMQTAAIIRLVKEQRKAQQPQPATAADFGTPQEAQSVPDAGGLNFGDAGPGKYKYG